MGRGDELRGAAAALDGGDVNLEDLLELKQSIADMPRFEVVRKMKSFDGKEIVDVIDVYVQWDAVIARFDELLERLGEL